LSLPATCLFTGKQRCIAAAWFLRWWGDTAAI
jgi:hypothetical protein